MHLLRQSFDCFSIDKKIEQKLRDSVLQLIVFIAAVAITLNFSACGANKSDSETAAETIAQGSASHSGKEQADALRYARGFIWRKEGNRIFLSVRHPWRGAKEDITYVLIPKGDTAFPQEYPGSQVIRTPVERVVLLSTTDLAQLKELEALSTLVGVGALKNVNTAEVLDMAAAGQITEVGTEMSMDLEAILSINPDLIISFSVYGLGRDGNRKMLDAGLPVVLSGSFMEETALGRSEWIKFLALFLGREQLADSLFAEMDDRYLALADFVKDVSTRPTVFLNAPIQSTWWVPGGKNYMARLLKDAGASYVWEEDTTKGSFSSDFEAVLGRASQADYWLNPSLWKSLNEGLLGDSRFALFRAVKEKKVYNNNLRLNASGGNDIYETGMVRPDLVLADLIRIFHPSLLPDHELFFYRNLSEK